MKEFHYITYIKTTSDDLWDALTSAETTRRYWDGWSIVSNWKIGSPVKMVQEDKDYFERRAERCRGMKGEVARFEPPRLLSYSWEHQFSDGPSTEPPSRVTFELEPLGDIVKLTVVHDDFEPDSEIYDMISQGWPMVLGSLKSMLETGQGLNFEELARVEHAAAAR